MGHAGRLLVGLAQRPAFGALRARPRFDVLSANIDAAFPGRFEVRPNPQGEPRTGAFEVVLKSKDGDAELWSKFATGQPSNLDATKAVAEAVVEELRTKV
eukprot:evm.model.scf_1062.4 EVM.evm.TU.scf_1062.4   scf_1062:35000-35404(+)